MEYGVPPSVQQTGTSTSQRIASQHAVSDLIHTRVLGAATIPLLKGGSAVNHSPTLTLSLAACRRSVKRQRCPQGCEVWPRLVPGDKGGSRVGFGRTPDVCPQIGDMQPFGASWFRLRCHWPIAPPVVILMHVRRTLIDGMHIPGSCSHPPSKCLGAWGEGQRAEPPDPLLLLCLRAACRGTAGYLRLLLFFSSEHHTLRTPWGTPTLVNFVRAVKSARDGSNRAEK